jgi:hypothetical protein
MAEEGTLGLARAQDQTLEEPSKEELQRRMDQARDSISHTVTEIKENVANQVQAVKETLDWREQFKRRPVAWSIGAAGAGFCVGYCIAATVKGDASEENVRNFYSPESQAYAAQPIISGASRPQYAAAKEPTNGHDEGPGFFSKLAHTPAFGKVKDEAGSVGDAFIQELGKTAKQIVLPALMTSLKNFIGGYLPRSSSGEKTETSSSKPEGQSRYQPSLERGPS